MKDLRRVVRDISREALVSFEQRVSWSATGPDGLSKAESTLAAEIARHVNALLRAAIDAGDAETFNLTVGGWVRPVPEDWDFDASVDRSASEALFREQNRLLLGLAMWLCHSVDQGRIAPPTAAVMLTDVVVRFTEDGGLAQALADGLENNDPWDDWFLEELPDGEVHFIPVRRELLRATLVLALRIGWDDPNGAPFPDDVLTDHVGDLQRQLDDLERAPGTWRPLTGDVPVVRPLVSPDDRVEAVPPDASPDQRFRERVAYTRGLLDSASQAAVERGRSRLRGTALDLEKMESFRKRALEAHVRSRPIRAILERRSRVSSVTARPEGWPRLGMREWLPKSLFVSDSHVVGGDRIAEQIGRRSAAHEEIRQLAQLSVDEVWDSSSPNVLSSVLEAASSLRDAGYAPTLLLAPVSWQLRRALTGAALRQSARDMSPFGFLAEHNLDAFDAIVDGMALLTSPRVPADRMVVFDLAAAVRLEQWPSDDDSGIRLNLKSFDEVSARGFAELHPEVVGPDRTVTQTVEVLQERVLVDLELCWALRSVDPKGVIAVTVPAALRGPEPPVDS